MVYGKEGVFDAERLIDLLRALEAFRVTERAPDPEAIAAKASAMKNAPATPSVGLVQDTEQTDVKIRRQQMSEQRVGNRPSSWAAASAVGSKQDGAREALTFLLSGDGAFFREFLVEETVKGIDCLGRGGLQALGKRLVAVSPLRLLPGIGAALMESPLGPFGDLFAPPLTAEEEKVVENTTKLIAFLLGDSDGSVGAAPSSGGVSPETARSLGSAVQLLREDPELARGAREFAQKLARRAFELVSSRALRRLADRVGEPDARLAPA
jgi:aarF domain-containing kinase